MKHSMLINNGDIDDDSALRVLRDHGLPANSLQDVFRATTSLNLPTVLQRGRASAQLMAVHDLMHF